MGNNSINFFGMGQAVDTIEASTARGGPVPDSDTRESTSSHIADWSGVENRVIIIAVEAAGTFLGDGEGWGLMLVPSDT